MESKYVEELCKEIFVKKFRVNIYESLVLELSCYFFRNKSVKRRKRFHAKGKSISLILMFMDYVCYKIV